MRALRRRSAVIVGASLAFVVARPSFADEPARAEPSPPTESVRQARQRWAEGVAAYDVGKYEAACVAFEQAYALQGHPAVLRNLGQAELRLGRWVPAARHLARYLGEATAVEPSDRASAQAALEQASAHAGKLVIDAGDAGAEVLVDGDALGRSPLPPTGHYVEPGAHIVRVRRAGEAERVERIEAVAGRTTRVALAWASAAAPAAAKAASSPAAPSAPPSASASSPSARTWVVVGGSALTLASVALGVVFASKASSADSAANDARARATASAGPGGCALATTAACAELAGHLDDRARDRRVEAASFVAAGVFAAGTVATWLVWPRGEAAPSAAIVPLATPSGAALAVSGAF